LASVLERRFSDPALYEAAVRVARPRSGLVIEERGIFDARLVRVELDRVLLQRGDEALARSVYLEIEGDRRPFVFHAVDDQSSYLQAGLEITRSDTVLVEGKAAHFHRTFAPCQWAAMSLPNADLEHAWSVLVGRPFRIQKSSRHAKLPDSVMAGLRALHSDVLVLARSSPEILNLPAISSAIDHALTVAMIGCLQQGEERVVGHAWHRRQRTLRQFEEWLEAHPDQPVNLVEVCSVLGVPARTLSLYCHEDIGMGPIQYSRLRRMRRARLALQDANPTVTVSAIATQLGFWELGRFATAYAALFGESPSTTLARGRSRRRAS
jgi:AraC-like DNA-binding protein